MPVRSPSVPKELFAQRDDPTIRDQLVERYLPLAQALAHRYRHSGQPLDDLIQIASIGLIKAVDRFDPSRPVTFESYAVPTIVGELKRYHRDRGWFIRVPRQLQERALLVRGALPLLSQELGRSPTIGELARYVGLTDEEVLESFDAQDAYAAISLDAPADRAESPSLAERIPAVDDDLERAEMWAECEPHLRRLPERQRRLIELRFFRDLTQNEIGREMGMSQMHVSRLLAQTLDTLREAVGA